MSGYWCVFWIVVQLQDSTTTSWQRQPDLKITWYFLESITPCMQTPYFPPYLTLGIRCFSLQPSLTPNTKVGLEIKSSTPQDTTKLCNSETVVYGDFDHPSHCRCWQNILASTSRLVHKLKLLNDCPSCWLEWNFNILHPFPHLCKSAHFCLECSWFSEKPCCMQSLCMFLLQTVIKLPVNCILPVLMLPALPYPLSSCTGVWKQVPCFFKKV